MEPIEIGQWVIHKVAPMRPGHQRTFIWSMTACFAATSTYPIALLIYARDSFKYYMGIEAAWSVYVWLLIPVAAGVITVLVSDLFQYRIPRPQWRWWVVGFSILSASIAWGAWQDNNRLPSAQTVSTVNGVPIADYAVHVDKCLRGKEACRSLGLDQAALLSQTVHCDVANSPDIPKLLGSAEPAPNSKVYAYLCALLNYAASRNGNSDDNAVRITLNAIGYAAIVLKWLVYNFVVLFLICLFHNSVPTFNINPRTLTGLIIAWSILVTWFPFRLFSDWAIWYQDLDLLTTGDAPFFISLVFAIISFIVIVIDFIVTFGRLNPLKTVSAAWGVVAVIFGVFITIKPDVITLIFRIVYSFDISLVVPAILLLLGIVAWHAYAFVTMPNNP